MNIIIKERGEINFGICRTCKYNILGQIIDGNVYCGYGSSSGGGGGGGTTPDDGGGTQPIINNDDVWEDYNG